MSVTFSRLRAVDFESAFKMQLIASWYSLHPNTNSSHSPCVSSHTRLVSTLLHDRPTMAFSALRRSLRSLFLHGGKVRAVQGTAGAPTHYAPFVLAASRPRLRSWVPAGGGIGGLGVLQVLWPPAASSTSAGRAGAGAAVKEARIRYATQPFTATRQRETEREEDRERERQREKRSER